MPPGNETVANGSFDPAAPPLPDTSLFDRAEETLDNCSHLFRTFKNSLEQTGRAGIAAIHFSPQFPFPPDLVRPINLLVRLLNRKLAGRLSGTYKASPQDFYLLLVATGQYSRTEFNRDLSLIRGELERFFDQQPVLAEFALPHQPHPIIVEGVYLVNREGECSDNAMFRAFQELFATPPDQSAALATERHTVEEIIRDEAIFAVFQPIYSLRDGSLHGYESLSRVQPPATDLNIESLFNSASRNGLSLALEMLCRKKALQRLKEVGLQGEIFLNVCPALLLTEKHKPGFTADLLDMLAIDRSRVVFELTERTLISDYALFQRGIAHYRSQGYRIAIDDLGEGYAGLRMLSQVVPDYVKLARFLVKEIDGSPARQALAEALVCFSKKIGAAVIAEGIERPEELSYFRSIGTDLAQGYLLGRPAPDPACNRWDLAAIAMRAHHRRERPSCRLSSWETTIQPRQRQAHAEPGS